MAVDGPLVVVVVGPLVVVGGPLVVVVVPGGVSDKSGAVLPLTYSLGEVLGGVRYAIQSLIPQPMSRSPSNSAPRLVATIPDMHELPSPL